jgi:hypothetical protein
MEKGRYWTPKLVAALGAYLVLALIATVALDGILRAALWFFFGLLAFRTLVAARDQQGN